MPPDYKEEMCFEVLFFTFYSIETSIPKKKKRNPRLTCPYTASIPYRQWWPRLLPSCEGVDSIDWPVLYPIPMMILLNCSYRVLKIGKDLKNRK